MADSLRERIEKVRKAQVTATERALAELEANEEAPPPPPPKPKLKKKIGTGESSFDLAAFVKKTKAAIAATENPILKAKLKLRLENVTKNAE